MAKIGIVGIGFMGMIHYLAYQRLRGVKVHAICEVDPVRRGGDWRTIKGNFGPPGELMDLSGVAQYADLGAMLADPTLDAFKKFRCHDDFEHRPLHGTFFIDRQGKVRFQRISADPFLDVSFLEKEIARIDALTGHTPSGSAGD